MISPNLKSLFLLPVVDVFHNCTAIWNDERFSSLTWQLGLGKNLSSDISTRCSSPPHAIVFGVSVVLCKCGGFTFGMQLIYNLNIQEAIGHEVECFITLPAMNDMRWRIALAGDRKMFLKHTGTELLCTEISWYCRIQLLLCTEISWYCRIQYNK